MNRPVDARGVWGVRRPHDSFALLLLPARPLALEGGAAVHEPRVQGLHGVVRVEKTSEVLRADHRHGIRVRTIRSQKRPPPRQNRGQSDVVIGVDVRDPHALEPSNDVVGRVDADAAHQLPERPLAGVHKHRALILLVDDDAGHVAVLGGRRRSCAQKDDLRVPLVHRGETRGNVQFGVCVCAVSGEFGDFGDSRGFGGGD
mmetsp:Transcript_992/g.4029  ORF Transcript_992/g.4029 Transcript_992/m.4029 type:complete len:201 (-) Transcript_992:1022-1624(-)